MALIKCPECGREVSDKALSCPNCGYPISQDPLEWAMDFETSPSAQASEPKKEQPVSEAAIPSGGRNYKTAVKKKDHMPVIVIGVLATALITIGIINGVTSGRPKSSSESSRTSSTSSSSTSYSGYSGSSSSKSSGSSKYSSATTGERNALDSAKSYLRSSAFSYSGLIDQLKYEGYSASEAKYGVDNCDADWNEQAVKCAKAYLDTMSFSKQGLIEQLEYEGFTHDQAVYGVEHNGY